jgi:hypothetical protein
MPDPAIEITAEISPPAVRDIREAPVDPAPIPLLRWPDQDAERRRLVARGEPRILVLTQYSAPAGLLDDLEVWVLDGADPRDILRAMDTLRRKSVERRPGPVLDDDGILRFGGSWVSVPDTQIPVVDLLVRNVDRLVPNDDLRTAYESAGGSPRSASIRTLVQRVRQRLATVGLHLHVIRRRGVMLAISPPETGSDEPRSAAGPAR